MSVELFFKPRFASAFIALGCSALLGFGIYLQEVLGLEPCPMCIVQRYAFILIAMTALLSWTLNRTKAFLLLSVTAQCLSAFGAFVAARQSWLQWFPPETMSCGRDLYGMIENFPLKRAIPMIFKGSGDCSVVDWTLLGGSIANWSYICFLLIFTYIALLQVRAYKTLKDASRGEHSI
jgi:disulfide bond formation protein DsbB